MTIKSSNLFNSLKSSEIPKVLAPRSLLVICLVVWNMNFLIIHSVGNVIIPTDELIFFRGVGIPPTRLYCAMLELCQDQSIDSSSSHKLHWNSFVVFPNVQANHTLYRPSKLNGSIMISMAIPGFWIGGTNHIHKAYFWGLNFREYPQKIWPYIWY